jgi:hypothetical protein
VTKLGQYLIENSNTSLIPVELSLTLNIILASKASTPRKVADKVPEVMV